MHTYSDFAATAPSIAGPIRERLERAGLTMLATIRRDGSPRISPVEVTFVDDRLYFGSMPGARKAQDLDRDPCALITPLADKRDMDGEGKLFAEARLVTDAAEAERMIRANAGDNEIDPEALLGSPVYEILVTAAAWQKVDDDAWTTASWKPGEPIRHRSRSGATGEVNDIT